ncbi:bifunctional folylpolyglutamate synthase/dihydrofolate synthase [Pikeienuella sp. HZG-20]|uniref:bifunctional folylpolyglutamate synthase/dihydrofolate synthase n=1 Tax=Paludibacillus litoralis TaxID=3133267 RepID=UPI0030EBC37C
MSDGPPAAGSDVILDRLLTLHPKIIDLTLERLERLLVRLGHPERDLPPVVHVAGTNGKGSCVAVIRAGLEAAGRKAHVYTSPHLARFHERIRLAGDLIDEAALAAILAECEAANAGAPITFFEITTAAAFLAFARSPADFTLLEVGLGGRLDATNVIAAPALTVITPVSIDHQQYLGETLAEIAAEKAGILKPGALCVVGPQQRAALDVIEARAAAVGAPLSVHERDWTIALEAGRLVFRDAAGRLEMAAPALPGGHQVQNAGVGVAALRALGLADAAAAAAPGGAVWPARIQRLTTGAFAEAAAAAGAELWLDGGHNPAAGEALAAHFASLPPAKTHLICGMLDTKDPEGFIAPFRGLAAQLHAVAIPANTAAIAPARLAAAAQAAGVPAAPADGVESALRRALDQGATRILICGSLYLAGWVLRGDAG